MIAIVKVALYILIAFFSIILVSILFSLLWSFLLNSARIGVIRAARELGPSIPKILWVSFKKTLASIMSAIGRLVLNITVMVIWLAELPLRVLWALIPPFKYFKFPSVINLIT